MGYGMITLQNNDDMRPRRKYGQVKIKVKQPWEVATGHREHRDTLMDNRPKRQRTRRDIDRKWRQEYDM
jgi:hypothetical protein